MLYLSQKEVSRFLTMESCIEVMSKTLKDVSQGNVVQPLRSAVRLNKDNILGIMPSQMLSSGIVGTKIITVYPGNHHIGLPSHQGVVLVFNNSDGSLKAIVDGVGITAIRTAAVSAVATRALARKESKHLAILGAGTQARTHLQAMLAVCSINEVSVWDYYNDSAEKFSREMSAKFNISINSYKTVKETVKKADIICTVTLAKEPILKYEWLKSGVHINAVGACTSKDREIDTLTVKNAKLYVDSIESAQNEAGCYLIPLNNGDIKEDHIVGEIGEVVSQTIKGRTNSDEITLFKSLGLAVEDLAAANYIYEEAMKVEQGTKL